ncbi:MULTISPECIES: hypothetical protein [Candidatus Nitrosocaldus]|jgi:hypothetical protein|uniref:Uncharacterized protein n=1 Tax=Candidatus Nitrosocaldus cavascurensis TaxID=2058097 RepID=A0A2K5AR27_9ARCH|nr:MULTISPECIES: hypothetical protein [Candidatus Nitrosocaldus]SPC34103.1 conserved protein of unknown function [Candidatus Nitrosocaldus cavascurensis]
MRVVDDASNKSTPNYAGNIIYILAGLPEFLRKPMMRNRLNEFFTLQEEDKVEMIRNVVDALPSMEMGTVARLFKTWLELLHEFGDERRNSIFSIYARVMVSNASKVARIDFAPLLHVLNSLDVDVRGATVASIKRVLQEMDEESKRTLLSSIPENVLREVGLHS